MRNRIADHSLTAAGNGGRSAAEQGQALGDAVRRQLDASRRSVEQFIAARPAVCLGIAVAAGVALGWWIKRR